MAKQADKKNLATMEYWATIMQALILVVNFLYIGSYVYASKYSEIFKWSYWDIIWFAIYLFVTLKTYQMICNALESGVKQEYVIDVFAVVLASQALSSYSPFWGGKILLLIPAYLVYAFGGYVV